MIQRSIRRFVLCLGLLSLLVPAVSHGALQKGAAAPAFKVTTTAGQRVTLDNYKGYVLAIDFFATWCPPCRASIPHLVNMTKKYGKQGFQILGLSGDEPDDLSAVKSFMLDKHINYPVAIIGSDDDLLGDYGVRSIPTVVIVNKKGVVVEKYMGFTDESGRAMEALIKKLLAE